jgi:ferredoxin-NADP reductase
VPVRTDQQHQLLRVTTADYIAAEVLAVSLTGANGRPLRRWAPGAHVDVLLPSGLVRQYSLCGSADGRDRYQIAILRVADGRGGSVEAHRTLAVGTQVPVAGPRNNFALVEADRYLFIAGGIGITPIAPMIHQVARSGAEWSAVYGGRSRGHMAFLGELTELCGDRLDTWPQDRRGLPNIGRLVTALPAGTAVYCCGPAGMLEAVERACAALPVPVDLHTERFTSAAADSALRTAFEVELRRSGVTVVVPADRSILDVVVETIGDVPFSCAEGICGTCETAVLEDVPEHHDQLLSAEERAAGRTMMICVGRARSPRLVLDL